jgi:hypothetical protein
MKWLIAVMRELAGLFVDDGMLALAITGVIALAAMVAHFVPGNTAGIVLLAGMLFALFANVMSAR